MTRINYRIALNLIISLMLTFSINAGGQQDTESNNQENRIAKPLAVFTSILPQKYFVEKIGGSRVQVEVLVGPGKSPATYEPSPHQIEDLGSSDILFTIGVPFEKAFLPAIESTLDSLQIVDTSAGIQKRNLNEAAKDPHIWLSVRLVKIQAENIYNALLLKDPAGEQEYTRGYTALLNELENLDAELNAALAPYSGSKFFVFHPAFGYFADDYELTQIAIEIGGKEPVPSKLEEIIREAKEQNVKIIFVQPEFSRSSARAIAEAIEGTVVMLNPLNPDYINNLKAISDEVQKAFE